MTKEKLISLEKYLDDLKSKLTSPVPEKHEASPATYKHFLNNEIRLTKSKIESAKLEGTTK